MNEQDSIHGPSAWQHGPVSGNGRRKLEDGYKRDGHSLIVAWKLMPDDPDLLDKMPMVRQSLSNCRTRR